VCPGAIDEESGAAEIFVDAQGGVGKGGVEGSGVLEADDERGAEGTVCDEILSNGLRGQMGVRRRLEGHWAPDCGEREMKF